MARARARVRVDLRCSPNASREEKERAFKAMRATFHKLVDDAGILTEYKRKSVHETDGERRRRKKKEADRERRKLQSRKQNRKSRN